MPPNLMNPLLNSLFFYPHTGSKFKELQKTLARSPQCTLLVPSTNTLEWCIDNVSLLPLRDMCLQEDFVASHIIQVPSSSRNHQRARYFGTLNGKTVVIKDGYVQTHKGFKSTAKAQILSEYVFYPASSFFPFDTQFIVYEIAVPLVGFPVLSAELSPTVSSKYEIASVTQSPKKYNIPQEPLSPSSPKDFERMMLHNPLVSRQLFGHVIRIIEQFSCSECETEDDLINLLDGAVDDAVVALQSCDSNAVSAMANDNNLDGEDMVNLIYQYIEINVSVKIWKQLILIRKEKDQEAWQVIAMTKHIDISQIGLGVADQQQLFALDSLVWKATKELSKLRNSHGAQAKLDILLSVLMTLGSGQTGTAANSYLADETKMTAEATYDTKGSTKGTIMSADILVSLMVLVVLRSGLDYVNSELYYIQNFSHLDTQSGQVGYALMTFEAVLYHIATECTKLEPISAANKKLWDSVTDHEGSSELNQVIEQLKADFSEEEFNSIVAGRTKQGDSILMLCILSKNKDALSTILDFDIISEEYLVGDSNELGKTLLIAAVQTEEHDIITEVLGVILLLSENEQRVYLAKADFWNRTVAHYFFNAAWLIPKISHLIDWNAKDQNGQTPLYTICRCYDHPEYAKLLELGFDNWRKSSPNVQTLDHTDFRGNTLLHVVKTKQAIQTLLDVGVDINWPNEKGLTPVMTHSKFSRADAIEVLSKEPQLDVQRIDRRGMRSMEMAKDPDTIRVLDRILVSDDISVVPANYVLIIRSIFLDNELQFIIANKSTTPLVEDEEQIEDTTITRRSINDFQFLQKWLAYENQFSWIPSIRFPRNPFSVSAKTSRQIIRELEIRLNAFLRTLMLHPVFGSHELLWEFLVLPELDQQQVIDRSRLKLESKKEAQFDEDASYQSGDLELISTFLGHARQQTSNLSITIERLANMAMHLKNKDYDLAGAYRTLQTKAGEVEFVAPWLPVLLPETELAFGIYDDYRCEFAICLSALADVTHIVISAINVPLGLIDQLQEKQIALEKLRQLHGKNVNKNGWTSLNLFQEKQQRYQKQLEDRLYISHNEIERISKEIRQGHVTVASEVGGFHEMREKELNHIMEKFARKMIVRGKENHSRLERALSKFRAFNAHCTTT